MRKNIQLVNRSGFNKYGFDIKETNSMSKAKTLDSFDINIIDIRNERLWSFNHSDKADLKSLSIMLEESKLSETIIVFPDNLKIINQTSREVLLKDYLSDFQARLSFLVTTEDNSLTFGGSKSNVKTTNIEADFYFKEIPYGSEALIHSDGSNKIVAYRDGNIYLTTLQLNNDEQLKSFLSEVGLLETIRDDKPEWMEDIMMFDDYKQKKIIEDNEAEISKAELEIEKADKKLFENERLKSILYTQSDSLVEVVFEILEELTGCDLSNFEDMRKEDFIFEIEEKVFIGEIKGVTSNIRNLNVSQLDVHYQEYIDNHDNIDKNNVFALLIMNHQRSKPLNERQDVAEGQIKLAQRNESLIIETDTLLKLLEKYRAGDITREECIELLSDKQSGLLKI